MVETHGPSGAPQDSAGSSGASGAGGSSGTLVDNVRVGPSYHETHWERNWSKARFPARRDDAKGREPRGILAVSAPATPIAITRTSG